MVFGLGTEMNFKKAMSNILNIVNLSHGLLTFLF